MSWTGTMSRACLLYGVFFATLSVLPSQSGLVLPTGQSLSHQPTPEPKFEQSEYRGRSHRHDKTNGSTDFKYLVFSQQTSGGFCRASKQCFKDHIRPFWTIHGMWPSNGADSPVFCDREAFKPSLVADIRDNLEQYWPSMSANNQKFWSHEWTKHGTCARELQPLSGQHSYFSTTLKLGAQWNLTRYLEQAAIRPNDGQPYKVADVKNAINSSLRKNANFVCKRAHGLEYPFLVEVRICISKQLSVIDCPDTANSCGQANILYLKYAAAA